MSYIEWIDRYNTGIPDIDRDHKGLFALINDLHNKIETGFSESSVSTTIEALENYVDYHFAREEALMESCGYPDIETHRAGHRLLHGRLENYKLLFEQDRTSFDIDGFLNFTRHWLTSHILEEDMAYVPCIQQRVESIVDFD